MIRYGVNPIAWTNDDDDRLGADIPLARCLREAGEIGFDGIEKGRRFPTEAAALKAALAPHGLAYVSGWHSLNLLARSLEDEKRAIQPSLDLLGAMGASVCIVAETSNSVHGRDDVALNDRPVLAEADWPRFAAAVEEMAAHVAASGLTLVYHPHVGTVVETGAEIDRLMDATGPATRLLFDAGHCFLAGDDPAAVLARHAGRVAHIHAKNVRREVMAAVRAEGLSFLEGVRRGVFTVPGDPEGAVDFAPLLRIAAAAGYDGWLVIEAEQDPAVRDPRRYQAMGLRALRATARAAGLDRGQDAAPRPSGQASSIP